MVNLSLGRFSWRGQRREACRGLTFILRCHLLLLFLALSMAGAAWGASPRVLLLSSYGPAFPTFFQQVEGVRAVLASAGVVLDVEFMDSKRFTDESSVDHFESYLRYKLARLPAYDVVITSDDNALGFVMERHGGLLGKSPVVFCGVNNVGLARSLSGSETYTGVIEAVSMHETIKLVWSLKPSTQTLYVISDVMPAGKADLETFHDVVRGIASVRYQELSLENMGWEELGRRLQRVGANDAILLLSAYKDQRGVVRNFEEGLAFILQNTRAPVYHLWEHGMGKGLLGGKLISHYEQGRLAAEMALKILAGASPASLPVIEGNDANAYLFDYEVLRRHGISTHRIPQGSRVINEPESIWRDYWRELLVAVAFVAVLCVLVVVLLKHVLRLREARTEIKRSETRYRLVFDQSPLGLVQYDGDGIIIDVNERFAELCGASRDQIIGFNYINQMHDARMLGAVLASLRGGIGGFEGVYTSPLGKKTAFIRCLFKGVKAPAGDVFIGIGIIEDVSDRKQAEEALRERELFLLETQRIAKIGGWKANIRTDYLFWSEEVNRILDLPEDYKPGLAEWLTSFMPEYLPRIRAMLEDVLHHGGTADIECEAMTRLGRRKWTHLRAVGRVDEGSGALVVGTFQDVDERKRTELELVEAKTKAVAANRAKDEFLANMSHEIRTPLNGIFGMLRMLADASLAPRQQELAEMAMRSCRRLADLLTDVLDISRIDAGKLEIVSSPFDLSRSIRQVRELFIPSAMQAGVSLHVHIDAAIPSRVVGDASRLQQVLTNLLGNAFKFTEKGSVTLRAEHLSPVLANSCRVLFSVEDTGCGIPDEKHGKLFTPFTQACEGFKRSHQGAGLGLSICRRIIRVMGGHLAFESEAGTGTTVYFTLNFGLPDGDEVQPEAAAASSAEPIPPLRVLVTEDDAVTRRYITYQLDRDGHTVAVAEDGRQALEQLSTGDFDMVLMDIQMPVMDGAEAILRIRKGEAGSRNTDIPVIALTAYALSGDRERLLQIGADDYVAKPAEVAQLHAAIARHVSRMQLRRADA